LIKLGGKEKTTNWGRKGVPFWGRRRKEGRDLSPEDGLTVYRSLAPRAATFRPPGSESPSEEVGRLPRGQKSVSSPLTKGRRKLLPNTKSRGGSSSRGEVSLGNVEKERGQGESFLSG